MLMRLKYQKEADSIHGGFPLGAKCHGRSLELSNGAKQKSI